MGAKRENAELRPKAQLAPEALEDVPSGGKSPAIWVLPQRLFRAAAWIAIGASIAQATAEPAKRSSNSPGFGFATNQRAATRHGFGTVLARFRVESAASQYRLGAQALDRNLALRHAGPRTGGGDHRRIEFRRRSISGG